MDDELVLVTSYFNLVEGRRQDTADTFRVESDLASSTSPDGHAALYIVTEASTGGHIGPRARRIAADTVAWEYSSAGTEPPVSRLKRAMRAAHEAVHEEFDGHVTVGMSVIAVEADVVYLGQVAPAQVYVLHEGGLHSIPATTQGSSPFARSLGGSVVPRISVFRDQVGPGDVLALCSSWFQRTLDPEDLRGAFSSGAVEDISESLLELARDHDARAVTAIVIEGVPASELQQAEAGEAGPGFMAQVDSAVAALAGVGRMFWQELRGPDAARVPRSRAAPDTESGAYSPQRSSSTATLTEEEPGPGTYGSQTYGGEVRLPEPYVPESYVAPTFEPPAAADEAFDHPVRTGMEGLTEEIPVVPDEHSSGRSTSAPMEQTMEIPVVPSTLPSQEPEDAHSSYDEPFVWPDEEPEPGPQPERERPARSELDEVNARLNQGPDMGNVIPPVQAFPDTSTEPERIYATSKDIQAVNRRPRRFGGIGRPVGREVGEGPPIVRPPVSSVNLTRPSVHSTPPALIWLGIALVGVLALVAVWRFVSHGHGVAVVNPYPTLAQKDIALAQSAKNPGVQDTYLAKARKNIALAQQNGASIATVNRLKASLATTTDSLHHITRISNPTDLGTFQRPTQIAESPAATYVLDAGRQTVYSVVQGGSGPTEVLHSGEIDGSFTVGTPVQIATDGQEVVILDNQNTVVRDSAGQKTATTLPQGSQNEKIAAMGTVDPDIYVLDPASNQIWRYPYATSLNTFNPSPLTFFDPNGPTLSNAVSFASDAQNIYILGSDGKVQKFDILHAGAQPFAISAMHTPLSHPVTIFTDQGLNDVWIADPANARILQLDKTGKYVRAYRSGAQGPNLHQLKSVVVGPKGTTLFFLAGNKLYSTPVVP